jgi:hypothetical protein
MLSNKREQKKRILLQNEDDDVQLRKLSFSSWRRTMSTKGGVYVEITKGQTTAFSNQQKWCFSTINRHTIQDNSFDWRFFMEILPFSYALKNHYFESERVWQIQMIHHELLLLRLCRVLLEPNRTGVSTALARYSHTCKPITISQDPKTALQSWWTGTIMAYPCTQYRTT